MNQKLKIKTYMQTRDISCGVVAGVTIKPAGLDIKRFRCDNTGMTCMSSVLLYTSIVDFGMYS